MIIDIFSDHNYFCYVGQRFVLADIIDISVLRHRHRLPIKGRTDRIIQKIQMFDAGTWDSGLVKRTHRVRNSCSDRIRWGYLKSFETNEDIRRQFSLTDLSQQFQKIGFLWASREDACIDHLFRVVNKLLPQVPFTQHHDIDRATFETPTFRDKFQITLNRWKRGRMDIAHRDDIVFKDSEPFLILPTSFLHLLWVLRKDCLPEYYPIGESCHWTCRNLWFRMSMDNRELSVRRLDRPTRQSRKYMEIEVHCLVLL